MLKCQAKWRAECLLLAWAASTWQCTINLSYPKQKAGSHIHLTENIRMAPGSSNTEPCVPPSSDRLESAILHTSANFASIFEYFHSSSENEKTNQVSSRVSGGECLEAMYNQSVISQTKGWLPYTSHREHSNGTRIIKHGALRAAEF